MLSGKSIAGRINEVFQKLLNRLDTFPYWDLVLSIITFIYISYHHAWLSDDAFISFRVVDNFANDFGLRWNVAERVQVYTNPLLVLLLLLPYILWKNIVALSFVFSFLFGILSLFFLKKISSSKFSFFIAVIYLFSSRAFIDYTYSGLENSLNHLIQAVFFFILWKVPAEPKKSKLPALTFWVSIGLVSRLDLILVLFIPYLVLFFLEYSKGLIDWKTILRSALFGSPIIIWFLFAGIYYGSFLPNTYYAKTNITDTFLETALQGWHYYERQLFWDPISLLFFPTVILIGFFFKRFNRSALLSLASLLPFFLYLIWVGGDFMVGRFFTPAIFLFGLSLAKEFTFDKKEAVFLLGSLAIYNILFPLTPFSPMPKQISYYKEARSFETGMPYHITDEKGFYYLDTGLAFRKYPSSWLANLASRTNVFDVKESVVILGMIGRFGYVYGPDHYIVDQFALGDPLLARLPGSGRTGHKKRRIPEGYIEGLKKGENGILDPDLKQYYDGILILTRGPIFTIERWNLFWKFQFGEYRKYTKEYK
ncbi:hypothetical protein [Leptospira dzoumogneensis]|uniref:Glycosyltransferase RgtA/B/C/D-like domain-containing protein n=1 Tax=Leptospira dzoumogneensis TaxID=2484904 RepID=A0A4Z1AZM1_9LEPT|nr:hypothetical protein [Leptospira dzoumogneensis]TGN03176.1 hypothetical protein EHR06_03975 [Leptospira dzoumogneensis]